MAKQHVMQRDAPRECGSPEQQHIFAPDSDESESTNVLRLTAQPPPPAPMAHISISGLYGAHKAQRVHVGTFSLTIVLCTLIGLVLTGRWLILRRARWKQGGRRKCYNKIAPVAAVQVGVVPELCSTAECIASTVSEVHLRQPVGSSAKDGDDVDDDDGSEVEHEGGSTHRGGRKACGPRSSNDIAHDRPAESHQHNHKRGDGQRGGDGDRDMKNARARGRRGDAGPSCPACTGRDRALHSAVDRGESADRALDRTAGRRHYRYCTDADRAAGGDEQSSPPGRYVMMTSAPVSLRSLSRPSGFSMHAAYTANAAKACVAERKVITMPTTKACPRVHGHIGSREGPGTKACPRVHGGADDADEDSPADRRRPHAVGRHRGQDAVPVGSNSGSDSEAALTEIMT